MANNSAEGIRWNLSDLFTAHDDARIEKTLTDCRSQAERFAERFRAAMENPQTLAADTLLHALNDLEIIYEALGRVGSYAGLLYAADTAKPEYQDLEQQVEQRSTEIRNLLLFFELAWLKVEDDIANRLIDDPQLESYRHYLDQPAPLSAAHALGARRKTHQRKRQHRTQRFRPAVLGDDFIADVSRSKEMVNRKS